MEQPKKFPWISQEEFLKKRILEISNLMNQKILTSEETAKRIQPDWEQADLVKFLLERGHYELIEDEFLIIHYPSGQCRTLELSLGEDLFAKEITFTEDHVLKLIEDFYKSVEEYFIEEEQFMKDNPDFY